MSLKDEVEMLVTSGTLLADIIRQVNVTAIDKALVMNYGNQTKAAEQLQCHRQVIRKYTLVRREKPMVGRWRDNTGERPIRRDAVEVEYNDGTSEVTYAHHVCWVLGEVDVAVKRWRPWYA